MRTLRLRRNLPDVEGSNPEPGDVLQESGPRIGTRYSLVVDARVPRTLIHLDVEPLNVDEAQTAVRDGGILFRVVWDRKR